MDCELCGAKNAGRVAIIDGIKMVVCDRCVKAGKEVKERPVKTKKKRVTTRPIAETEKVVVADFPKRIREARMKMDLEQKELAKRLAEKQSIISKVESGSLKPSLSLAKKLEKALKIALIEETEPVEFESEEEGEEMTLGDMMKLK